MTAKSVFKKLGYNITEENVDEIQYTKQADISELKRVGMREKVVIEFYSKTKEVLLESTFSFKDGSEKPSTVVLSLDEFLAIKNQIMELNWYIENA